MSGNLKRKHGDTRFKMNRILEPKIAIIDKVTKYGVILYKVKKH